MNAILPEGWKRPIGYSNAIESRPGKLLFVAGQVGWTEDEVFESEEIAPQFEQALKNILAIVTTAGGRPEHICRITAFCIDKPAYLKARPALGAIWRKLMGKHFPAMSMIFVADLLDTPGKIELEATAVIPED
ncbi:MAG TPA: RidA family protein [Alphaproteobacteria bacterium]|nr:RidA family protein [Alphaproteobacteria bacterium]